MNYIKKTLKIFLKLCFGKWYKTIYLNHDSMGWYTKVRIVKHNVI